MNKLTFTIASNTIYQFISRFLSSIAVLIVTILVVRYAGIELYGQYSVVISYLSLWLILIDFGFNPIVVKRIADKPEKVKDEYSQSYIFRIYLSIIVIFLSLLTLLFLPYDESIKYSIVIASPILLFTAMIRSTLIIFQYLNTYWKNLIATFWGVFLNILLIIGFMVYKGYLSLNLIVYAYLLNVLVISVISTAFTSKYYKFHKLIDIKYIKSIVIPAIPIGLVLIFNMLMIQVDRFILSIFDTPISVGFYTLSYKIFEFILVIPVFVMNSAYPILINYRKNNVKLYMKSYKKLMMILALIALFVLFFIPFTNLIIVNLWGPEMYISSEILNILIIGTIFFFLTAPLSWKLIIEGRQSKLLIVYGLGLVLNTILNVIFIPQYGVYAAAINTIISEIGVLILLVIFNLKNPQ